jgi:hypothetical protein
MRDLGWCSRRRLRGSAEHFLPPGLDDRERHGQLAALNLPEHVVIPSIDNLGRHAPLLQCHRADGCGQPLVYVLKVLAASLR